MGEDVVERVGRIVRPIVEGQIRSFLHDHPEIAEAVAWKIHPRFGGSKREALVHSIAKRINCDLLCGTTTARLRALLCSLWVERAVTGDVEVLTASLAGGVEVTTAPPAALDGGGE